MTKKRGIICLLLVLTLSRGVYVISYPFLIEGDGHNYYEMLSAGESNLLHATGYVYLSLGVWKLFSLIFQDPSLILTYYHHAVSVGTILLLYLALRRITAHWLSLLVCVLIGVETLMIAAAGTTRPEFFQANLLMLIIASLILAFTDKVGRSKFIIYAVAGALFVAGYLTKYNLLPMLVFIAVPFLDADLDGKQRIRAATGAVICAAVFFAVFLFAFHYPTTRSLSLNLEHGWIHILKLREAGIPINPRSGIASQKYLILIEQLPQVNAGSGDWRSIDEVPATVRDPFRREWMELLSSKDPATVENYFAALGPSTLDGRDYYDPNVFCTIYHHLGLEEGEALLGQVFIEGVRNYLPHYLANVWNEFLESADFAWNYMPYLPVPGVLEEPSFFEYSTASLLSERATLVRVRDLSLMGPEEFARAIWLPGARVFFFLSFMKHIPAWVWWIMMIAGLLLCAASLITRRRVDAVELFHLLSLLTLLGIMALSAVLYGFRMKELILCVPLIYLTSGLSIQMYLNRLRVRATPVSRE